MQTQHCPSSIDRDGGESLAIDIEFRGEDRLGVEVFQRGFRNGFDESQRRIHESYVRKGVVATRDDLHFGGQERP